MARVITAIAVVALLAAAGCAGAPAAPTTTHTSATPTESPTQTGTTTTPETTTHDGYYRSYTVQASATSIDSIAAEVAQTPDELGRYHDDYAQIVRVAARNGSAGRVKMGSDVRLGLQGELVVVNGTYYRIDAAVDWRENVTAHLLKADGPLENRYEGGELASYRVQAVNYSDLPPGDRGAVNATINLAEVPSRGYHGIGYWHYFQNGTVPENSTLADGETHVVRYNDTLWKIQLRPDRTSEQVRYHVTYTLNPVAANETAWHDYVRAHNVTDAAGLPVSNEARSVLNRALDEGMVEWEGRKSEPPGFRELFEYGRRFYVARNGTFYRVTIVKVVE